ncbi:hypothetical protein J6590_071524 [Homalodisca vitripennis]|nr:hypothetical protein J6590_071524 [Homalodisca vitripennis]
MCDRVLHISKDGFELRGSANITALTPWRKAPQQRYAQEDVQCRAGRHVSGVTEMPPFSTKICTRRCAVPSRVPCIRSDRDATVLNKDMHKKMCSAEPGAMYQE